MEHGSMDYAGTTALVTGASSGIGVAYARELAARGANLVLVARRGNVLDEVALSIRQEFPVTVTTIAMDLAVPNAGQTLKDNLDRQGITPEILINNAGFGTNARLENEDPHRLQEEISLNVATLVDLTRAYLPGMLASNVGAIVNIASTAAYQPVPGMAVYAATKAFVLSFTSAVWGEVTGTDVRVLAVSPGATATDFFTIAGAQPSGGLAPVSAVINTTFKALDAKNSRPAVVVGRKNAMMSTMTSFFPKKSVIRIAGGMFLPKK
jgi:short-subunit dehydrogenase